ncbi:bifunctional RNase H/acid phosphatase [Actinoalloteichus spitiensis]|uniref:bifunctional RNase H/acid phosphatase n=1 Tax=Actinoalloteichus spitiensis TaxID=252394 RepID=UPI00035E7C56|nr:bifunctional RNase H/acid phosphatase [Actinoalloteichus spitiensis]
MTSRVVVEADGGSRGNPGPAGYGAVVFDADTGAVLVERAEALGVATNNVAEYQGLIAGLRAAEELGAAEVAVRMDSKLVVEQMSGRWKIKHPQLQPLALTARDLARRFDRVSYEWIPRARNAHADRLANQAMDAQSGAGRDAPGRAAREPAGERPSARDRASSRRDDETHRGDAGAAPTAARWSGATGVPTRLVLVRHGETEYSRLRRYAGRGDVPLTEFGHAQAAAAGRRVAQLLADGESTPVPVVSSPLSRTLDTAKLVADAVRGQVVVSERLVECDFGEWDGLTFGEAADRDPELHARWLRDTAVAPPGGESLDAVHRRVRRARDELIAEHGGRTVVVVSHVSPIKALLRMALDVGPSLMYRLHLDVASVSVASFYPDGHASVTLVNDTTFHPERG